LITFQLEVSDILRSDSSAILMDKGALNMRRLPAQQAVTK